jgi:hypothetical protein
MLVGLCRIMCSQFSCIVPHLWKNIIKSLEYVIERRRRRRRKKTGKETLEGFVYCAVVD